MTTTDERLLILHLLRDGKITTDEAERLLRALSTPTDRTRKGSDFDRLVDRMGKELRHFGSERFVRQIHSLAERIRREIEDVLREARRPAEPPGPTTENGPVELAEGSTVHISQRGGNVALAPSSDRRLTVSAPNVTLRVDEERNRAEVSAVGGPSEAQIPPQVRRVVVETAGGRLSARGLTMEGFSARIVGGGATIEEVVADVELDVTGGGAELNNVAGKTIEVTTHGGNIRARLGDVREGTYRFAATGGRINLELGKDSEFEVEYTLFGGTFHSDWVGEPIGENRQRIASGSAKMSLTVTGGGIYLGRRE